MRAALQLSAVLLLLGGRLLPQSSGVLAGAVEDRTGARVPAAEITLTAKSDRSVRHAASDNFGNFEFPDLAPGEYKLKIEAKDFSTYEHSVAVRGPGGPPLRIRLELAAVAEEVEVTAESQGVPGAAENQDAARIGEHLFNALPVKEGDFLALPALFLDPAATGFSGPALIVDGMESSNVDLPLAAIKRIYVNRNPFSAEFGEPGAGRLEVLTKEGSRHHYHRELSATVNNAALNARNAFARTRPPMRRTLFEGDLDGPLWTNKASFLLASRYLSADETAVIHAQTPAGGLVQNVHTPERRENILGRIDFRLSGAHSLRISQKFKQDRKDNQGLGGFNLPERAFTASDREHKTTISETAVFSPDLYNDLRFDFKRETAGKNSVTSSPAVIVLDAFSAGGAQVRTGETERGAQLQDILSWMKGRHQLRIGGDLKSRFFRVTDASNFGGTFLFSDIQSYVANRPFLFRVNQGNPDLSFNQYLSYAFVQDELRLRENVSLSAGLRYEWQSDRDNRNNVAPRLGVAYAPGGGKTVLRLGAGVFYEQQPKIVRQDALLYDGVRIREIVLPNPGFPFPSGAEAVVPPSVVRIAPAIGAPYLIEARLGVERTLSPRAHVTLEYGTIRGVGLYLMRNINAPFTAGGARPDERFLSVKQFEASGFSRSNSVRIHFRAELGSVEMLAQYTLSWSLDDTSGLLSFPANSYDLRGEFGRSDFDRRSRLNVLASGRLPLRFKLGAIASVSSGIPFNVVTGFDDNGDTIVNDRPPGVGRNTGRGPGYANLDVRLSRKLEWAGDKTWPRLELRVDVFNLLNHVNFKNFVGTERSPFFGRANAAYPARQLQLSVKLRF